MSSSAKRSVQPAFKLLRRVGFAVLLLGGMQSAFGQLIVLWEREGDGPLSGFGGLVAPLGDQNDDGFDDWVVYGSGNGEAGQINETKLSFFHGGNPPPLEPYMVMIRETVGVADPFVPRITGDLDGDGYYDWYRLIRYEATPESTNVEIFFGGPDADMLHDLMFRIPIHSTSVDPDMGKPRQFDFNGDGFSDLHVYLQVQDGDYSYILFGGDPMDAVPDLYFHSEPHGTQNALPKTSGDVNGDGYDDFLTSDNAWPDRTTYLFLGSSNPDTLPDYSWTGPYYIRSPLFCDLNADGKDDLIRPQSLRMEVTLGRDNPEMVTDFGLTFSGCDIGPTGMGCAGDFNNDGYNDLLAVSEACGSYGVCKLYLGGPWLSPDPVITIHGGFGQHNLFGIRTAIGVGDVNGDGVDDFAVGATVNLADGRRGKAIIFSGDSSYHVGIDVERPELPVTLNMSVFPNPVNGFTTITVELPTTTASLTLSLYNTLGQRMEQLTLNSHDLKLSYDVSAFPTGVYFLHAASATHSALRKVVLLK